MSDDYLIVTVPETLEVKVIELNTIYLGFTINNHTGGGGEALSVTFPNPLVMWQVVHNRGYRPLVDVLDQFGEKWSPVISHVSINEFRVTFTTPQRGSVIYY